MYSSITVSLVPEAKGGPFVFWDDLEQACAQASNLGFDAVEVFPRSVEELNAKALRSTLQKHNLRLAGMGTGAGWVVQKLRFSDPDPVVRRRAQDFAGGIIDFAGSFGAPAIIGSMQGRADGNIAREQALQWLAEALEYLGPRASALEVPLLIEPLNRYETNLLNRVEPTLDFLNSLRTRNVKLLCDLFHMNIEEPDISAALLAAGSKLGHVHFADSNRMAIGLGHTEISPIAVTLQEMNYTGAISAEVLPLPDTVTAARQTISSFKKYFPKPC